MEITTKEQYPATQRLESEYLRIVLYAMKVSSKTISLMVKESKHLLMAKAYLKVGFMKETK